MNKLFILLTFLVGIQMISAQTTLLSEDFNDGFPAGWQLLDLDGLTPNSSSSVNYITEAFTMDINSDSVSINDSILVSTSYFDSAGKADDYLILPALQMGGYGNYIHFQAKSFDASYPEAIEIRVSTGGVEPWAFFTLEPVYQNPGLSPYWTTYEVSLDSLPIQNQMVRIAFRNFSTDKFKLGLDNISVVVDDPVSTQTQEPTHLAIYPNPADQGEEISFSDGQLHSYRLINTMGQLIKTETSANSISTGNLANGLYLVKIDNKFTSKLIIE